MHTGQSLLVKRNGNVFDVVNVMRWAVNLGTKEPRLQQFVRRNPMNEKQIFDFVRSNVLFKPDLKNRQTVRTLLRTLRDGEGNCVDMSVATATLLKMNGINGKFRMVSVTPGKKYKHIFVISDKKLILDPVIGLDQSGETNFELRKDKIGKFNRQVPFFSNFDKNF